MHNKKTHTRSNGISKPKTNRPQQQRTASPPITSTSSTRPLSTSPTLIPTLVGQQKSKVFHDIHKKGVSSSSSSLVHSSSPTLLRDKKKFPHLLTQHLYNFATSAPPRGTKPLSAFVTGGQRLGSLGGSSRPQQQQQQQQPTIGGRKPLRNEANEELKKIRPDVVSYRSSLNLDPRMATVINAQTGQVVTPNASSSTTTTSTTTTRATPQQKKLKRPPSLDVQNTIASRPSKSAAEAASISIRAAVTAKETTGGAMKDKTSTVRRKGVNTVDTMVDEFENNDLINNTLDDADNEPVSVLDARPKKVKGKAKGVAAAIKEKEEEEGDDESNNGKKKKQSGTQETVLSYQQSENDNDDHDIISIDDNDELMTPYNLYTEIQEFKYRIAIGKDVQMEEIEEFLDKCIEMNCPEAIIEAWELFDDDTYDGEVIAEAAEIFGIKNTKKSPKIPKLNVNIYTTTIFACSLVGSSSLAYSIYCMMSIDPNVVENPYPDEVITRLLNLTLNPDILAVSEDNNVVMSLYTDLCYDLATTYGIDPSKVHDNFQKQEDQTAHYLKFLDYLNNPDKRYSHRLAQDLVRNPYESLQPVQCKPHLKSFLTDKSSDPHFEVNTPAITSLSTSLVLLACVKSAQNFKKQQMQAKLDLQRAEKNTRAHNSRKSRFEVDAVMGGNQGNSNSNEEQHEAGTVERPFDPVQQESPTDIDNIIRAVMQRVLYHDVVKITPSHIALAALGTYTLSFKHLPTLEKLFLAYHYRGISVVPQTLFALMHVAKEVNSRFHQFMYFDMHFVPPNRASFQMVCNNMFEVQKTRKMIIEQGKNMIYTSRNQSANNWYQSLDEYTKQMYHTDGGSYGIASRFGHMLFPNLLNVVSNINNSENKKRSAAQIWESLLSHGDSSSVNDTDGDAQSASRLKNLIRHEQDTIDLFQPTTTTTSSSSSSSAGLNQGGFDGELGLISNAIATFNDGNDNESIFTKLSQYEASDDVIPTTKRKNMHQSNNNDDYYSTEQTILTPDRTNFHISIQRPIFYSFILVLSAMRGLPYSLWSRFGEAAPTLWRESLLLSEVLGQFTSEPDRYAFSLSIESAAHTNHPEPLLYLSQRLLERNGRVRIRLVDTILGSLQAEHLTWKPFKSQREIENLQKTQRARKIWSQIDGTNANTSQQHDASAIATNNDNNNNTEVDGEQQQQQKPTHNDFKDSFTKNIHQHVRHFFLTHRRTPEGKFVPSDTIVDLNDNTTTSPSAPSSASLPLPPPLHSDPDTDVLPTALPITHSGMSIISRLISTAMAEPVEYSIHQARVSIGLSTSYYGDKSFATKKTDFEKLKSKIVEFESEDEPDFEALKYLRNQVMSMEDFSTGSGNSNTRGNKMKGKSGEGVNYDATSYKASALTHTLIHDIHHDLTDLNDESFKIAAKMANPHSITANSIAAFFRAVSSSGNSILLQGILAEMLGSNIPLDQYPSMDNIKHLPPHLQHLIRKDTKERYNPSKISFKIAQGAHNDTKKVSEKTSSLPQITIPPNLQKNLSLFSRLDHLNEFMDEIKYSYLYTLDHETIPVSHHDPNQRVVTQKDEENFNMTSAYHPHLSKISKGQMSKIVTQTLLANALAPVAHNNVEDFPDLMTVDAMDNIDNTNTVLRGIAQSFDGDDFNDNEKGTRNNNTIDHQQKRYKMAKNHVSVALSNLMLWSLAQTGFRPTQVHFLGHIAALLNVTQIAENVAMMNGRVFTPTNQKATTAPTTDSKHHPSHYTTQTNLLASLVTHTNGGTLEQRLDWLGMRARGMTMEEQLTEDLRQVLSSIEQEEKDQGLLNKEKNNNNNDGANDSGNGTRMELSLSQRKANESDDDDGDLLPDNNGLTKEDEKTKKKGRRRFKAPFSFTFVHDLQKLEGKLSSRTSYRSFLHVVPEQSIGFGRIVDNYHRSQLQHVYLLTLESIMKGAMVFGTEQEDIKAIPSSSLQDPTQFPFTEPDHQSESKRYQEVMRSEYGVNLLKLYNLGKKRFNWPDLTTTKASVSSNQTKLKTKVASGSVLFDKDGKGSIITHDNSAKKSANKKEKTPTAATELPYGQLFNFTSVDEFISSLTPTPSVYTANGYNEISFDDNENEQLMQQQTVGQSKNTNKSTKAITTNDTNNTNHIDPNEITINQDVLNDFDSIHEETTNKTKGRFDLLHHLNHNNTLLLDFRQMSMSHATIAFTHAIHQYQNLIQTKRGNSKNVDKEKNPMLCLLLPKKTSHHVFDETPLISGVCTSEIAQKTNHFQSLFPTLEFQLYQGNDDNGQGVSKDVDVFMIKADF